jgi:hypothetical protein
VKTLTSWVLRPEALKLVLLDEFVKIGREQLKDEV